MFSLGKVCIRVAFTLAILLPVSAVAQILDDPMRPTTTRRAASAPAPSAPAVERFNPAQFPVQAVYVFDQARRVRIHGQELSVGDAVGSGEIELIETRRVVVRAQGVQYELPMAETGAAFRIMETVK